MNIVGRLQVKLPVTGVNVFEDGRLVRYLSNTVMTGAELASCLIAAIKQRQQLDAAIEEMSNVLENGETVEGRDARVEWENANPQEAAIANGWWLVEDYARQCRQGDTGFAKFLEGVTGRIVRPRDRHDDAHMRLGDNWPKYKERSFFWGDYFQFAEDWHAALATVRKERAPRFNK